MAAAVIFVAGRFADRERGGGLAGGPCQRRRPNRPGGVGRIHPLLIDDVIWA